MRTHCLLATSHTRRVPSSPPLSKLALSEVKARLYTAALCPRRATLKWPWTTSYSQIVLSTLPLATVRPSGLQATQCTLSLCPESVWSRRPLATSHSLTVRSQLPLARVRPSGAKARPSTLSVCPSMVCTHLAGAVFWTCHNRRDPAKSPLASKPPSGLQVTLYTEPGCGRIWRLVPLWASQNWTVASRPLLASSLPSGEKARQLIVFV